jgi:GT2 family glycosyltransferase
MKQVPPIELSIVIVNWNSREYVQRCIGSIEANTSGVSYEIIVIDSGSFDGCQSMLQHTYPDVRFVQSAANIGFGRANTLAASHARGSALLFLNPDTEVTEGAIERLYRHLMALSDDGVLGCRLLNSDGSVQTSSVQALPTILNQLLNVDVIRRWFPKASLFGARVLFERGSTIAEVEAVSGACMLVRREVFALVGGFSPEYFMYGEDLDLCFKTRSLGLRNYHVSDSVVIHHGGGSTQHAVSRFSAVMTVDSVNRLLRKSRGIVYSEGYRLASVAAALVRLAMLCLVAPAGLAAGTKGRWHATARKWLFIMSWGLRLERWTADYNGPPTVARAVQGVDTSCAESAEN